MKKKKQFMKLIVENDRDEEDVLQCVHINVGMKDHLRIEYR